MEVVSGDNWRVMEVVSGDNWRVMEVVSGDNWSCKACKAAVKSSAPTNQL